MEAFNEKISYENPFLSMKVIRTQRNQESFGRWHYHKELEILVILEGYMDIHIGDHVYQLSQGDVLFIGSSELHKDRCYEGAGLHYIILQFDVGQYFDPSTLPYLKFFSETHTPLSELNYIFQENASARQAIYNNVNAIYFETVAKQEGYEIAISILIKQMVLTLVRNDTRKGLTQKDSADIMRLKPVLDYIEQNVTNKIHVEEASRVANISYYYFVKYFKKVLGMSFLDYVNYKKIKKAEQLLLTQDYSVAYIGEQIGMPNMAHFYKIFKKFNHCSPNEFRKKML